MIDYIEKAKAFAMMAHKGQTDKAGEDYFTAHVAVVADGVEPDPLVKAAAYLHDTVEDTGTTIDTIRAEFPQEVAEAVSVLTRKKDMTYAEYIWRVKQNDIAVKVKRADLVSNMDLNRIPYPLTSKDLAREAKYLRAYKMLDGRKTVSAVNPYALYDYLITCGWESDPSVNSASESPVLKAPFGSYKVLVPLDMQRFAPSRQHRYAISSERSYTGRQHQQRASPEPRKRLFRNLQRLAFVLLLLLAAF